MFVSGSGLAAFGLYKWSKLRGLSLLIVLAPIIPVAGPLLALMSSPPMSEQELAAARIPAQLRLGLWLGSLGMAASILAPEYGLAAAVAGLGLALVAVLPEPERKRLRPTIAVVSLLVVLALLFSRQRLGPGGLW